MTGERWWALSPARKNYLWGSHTALQALLGEPPGPEPLAELWFGTHPDGPATLAGSATPLHQHLGTDRRERRLGFMAKLLAADQPLSIQVHPPGVHPASGDDCKHEFLIALTPMRVLCGFAPTRAAALRLHELGLGALAAELDRNGIAVLLERLLGLDATERTEAVRRAAAGDPLAALLNERHPDDAGVLAALLMNELTLQPGEGLALPAGTVHAYLHGVAFEAMTESDAVTRLGLTTKPIDPAYFLDAATLEPRRPERIDPDGEGCFPLGVGGICITHHGRGSTRAVHGPSLVVCTEGHVTIDGTPLAAGRGAFVPEGAPLTLGAVDGAAYAVTRRAV